MPKITFLPDNITIEYAAGGLPYRGEGRSESLLDVALNYDLGLRHACGGICACTTCHVIVRAGDENLSLMEKDEEDLIYRITDYTLHSRLACRAVVRGDVVVHIPQPSAPATRQE
ncbi:MAG: 2Fe-2S iron-sulfur cluster binding domain-containing protein [Acidobacteria bacterium]|nr:2Fe-2S iron-sulfur cluster binding domain-containing protein [Acidobacteriota bacterium]